MRLELFGGEGVTPGAGSGVHCLEQGPYQPIPFGPGQTDAFEVSNEQKPRLATAVANQKLCMVWYGCSSGKGPISNKEVTR